MKWYDYLVAMWFAFAIWANLIIVFDPFGLALQIFFWIWYENIVRYRKEQE